MDLLLVSLAVALLSFGAYQLWRKLQFLFYQNKNTQHAKIFPAALNSKRSLPKVSLAESFMLVVLLIPCLLGFAFASVTYLQDVVFMRQAQPLELVIEKTRLTKGAKPRTRCLVRTEWHSRYLDCSPSLKSGETLPVWYALNMEPHLKPRGFIQNHSMSMAIPLTFFLGLLALSLFRDAVRAAHIMRHGQLRTLPIQSALQFEVKGTTTVRLFTTFHEQGYFVDCAVRSWFKPVTVSQEIVSYEARVWVLGKDMAHHVKAHKTIIGLDGTVLG